MNTTAKALIFAVVSVASAASIGMGLADYMAQSNKSQIVKLERVVIEGRRAQVQAVMRVEQLPRVVIEGRRSSEADLQMAAAKQAKTI